MVRQFCKVFAAYRWIVCPSGSCSAMCRVFFPHVDSSEDVVRVSRRVFEFSEFLVDILHVTDTGASFPHKVALHAGLPWPAGAGRLRAAAHPAAIGSRADLLRAAEHRGVLRLRRHVQREVARHVAGDGAEQGGQHRPQRGRGRGFRRRELPDARRRHLAAAIPTTRHIRTMHLAEVLDAGLDQVGIDGGRPAGGGPG